RVDRTAEPGQAFENTRGAGIVRTDITESSIALLDQMLHCDEATADIVHRYGVDRQTWEIAVNEHQREAAIEEFAEYRHTQRAIDGIHDQSAGATVQNPLQLLGLERAVIS